MAPRRDDNLESADRGSWPEARMYVLAEFKDLREWVGKQEERLRQVEVSQAVLNVKAGVWGAAGAMIPVALLILIEYFRLFHK